MVENKIHVAYGFHVNCYHSYRGDTNDNLGFGSDIRIIRKTIKVLNEFNKQGIPVKGTWDFENFFSLQKILPEYAPDIISDIKERVIKYGDENIIMGYNNGALSAMTEDEFCESINLAVTNEDGSGLEDIFGTCEKIVRPQEVMFTPSQVKLYNKLGIKALCLYYSCVPFDAFRTIIPKLPDEEAFNPLTYTYNGESMTIIPTYNNSDVCDAGCLRAWVKELRKKQENGEINNDLFIFINMDADAIFWETMNLGKITGKIANTDGIHGLIKEISDLPYIVYDTPGGYIKNHKPIGKISFTQDTADGNFTGYASWSEKPFNRKIWTRLERARAMSKLTGESDALSPSFKDRVLLLSTTHFGLATPVLNIQREKTALDLGDKVISDETSAMPKTEKITVHNINGTPLQSVQIEIKKNIADISCMNITSSDLEFFTAVSTDSNCSSAFVLMKFKEIKAQYEIEVSFGKQKESSSFKNLLKTDRAELMFTPDGHISFAQFDGKKIGNYDFLQSYITYNEKKYEFKYTGATALSVAGNGEGIRVKGEIHLPKEIKAGKFTYDFFTTPFSDAIFVCSTVDYPYTAETTSISTENSALGRFSDMNWKEAVPFQITPVFEGDVSVIKRNFMDDISSFRTQSFPECDEKNRRLDSFNHQLSNGLVGLCDENGGIVIANSRQVLSSMAHCPMRLEEDKTVRMNPFGSYFGKQRHHFGRAKDEILGTYTLVAAQGKSIAPSYNGCSETAVIALYPITGNGISDKEKEEICAFADGALITAPAKAKISPFSKDNTTVREGNADGINEKDLKSPVLASISGNMGKYITRGAKAISHIIFTQIKSK